MSTRPLHLPLVTRPMSWAQFEFGLLAAMCAGGYLAALALAFG
jgi:hypothetical protein